MRCPASSFLSFIFFLIFFSLFIYSLPINCQLFSSSFKKLQSFFFFLKVCTTFYWRCYWSKKRNVWNTRKCWKYLKKKRSRRRIFNQCLIIKVQNKFHTNSFQKIAKRSSPQQQGVSMWGGFFPYRYRLVVILEFSLIWESHPQKAHSQLWF